MGRNSLETCKCCRKIFSLNDMSFIESYGWICEPCMDEMYADDEDDEWPGAEHAPIVSSQIDFPISVIRCDQNPKPGIQDPPAKN